MKKIFLYTLALLTSVSFYSCSDDDDSSAPESEREFMTMFRCEETTGRGSDDPYRCQVEALNDVHLYWYAVDGCAGYQVRVANQNLVANGADAWEETARNGWLVLDTIINDPECLELVVKDLDYSTDYRFAIRTLSKRGEAYHSKWYGHGEGRQWAEFLGLSTGERYPTPLIIEQSNITKEGFRVNINRSYAESGDTPDTYYTENFEVDENGNFVMHILTVVASNTNPGAKVPEKWQRYELTEEDFARGYVDIDGLDKNSVYVVNVQNLNNPIRVDAIYNSIAPRTDGDPGEPIFIPHTATLSDTLEYNQETGEVKLVDISEWNAMWIDTLLTNYTNNNNLAEGTIFELEGGKVYYFKNNPTLCKGFTMRTRPSDLAEGKGRAKVYLGGLWKAGTSVKSCNFMFGRQPVSGENSDVPIYVKSLIFEEIDWDCPLAEFFNGEANGTGNYFANMYSNGMPVTFQTITIRNCSFQHMVRGFIRVQGSKRKVFENVLVENCEFKNCGYYDNNGRGYAWVAGDGKLEKSNIFNNMVFQHNTFYDSPRTAFFTDGGKNLAWPASVKYNVTFSNNTVINFSTRNSAGNKIFDFRYLPAGSTITCENNLFVLTKDAADERNLYFGGMDIRQINGDPAEMTFNIKNNWSTNTNLTAGQIFTAGAFSATKNSAGKFTDMWPYGKEELDVHVCDIAPEDLFVDPNPKNYEQGDATKRHWTDKNLEDIIKFKNWDNDIVKNQVGAAKWLNLK